jgi:hypothetical protein
VRNVSCAFEWIGSIKRTQSGTDMPHSERASLVEIIDAQHLLELFPRVYRGAQCKLRFEMHLKRFRSNAVQSQAKAPDIKT